MPHLLDVLKEASQNLATKTKLTRKVVAKPPAHLLVIAAKPAPVKSTMQVRPIDANFVVGLEKKKVEEARKTPLTILDYLTVNNVVKKLGIQKPVKDPLAGRVFHSKSEEKRIRHMVAARTRKG